jgi:PPOX class probable F420-dependent enzyme
VTESSILGQGVRRFVADARTATLATIAPDGRPRLVPVCFVLLPLEAPDAAAIWTPLDDKPKRSADPHRLARVRDIAARPEVTILVDRWSEDWERLAWVRCRGRATLVEPVDGAVGRDAAIAALRAKYPQYRGHRLEDRPLIRIEIDDVTSWGAVGDD